MLLGGTIPVKHEPALDRGSLLQELQRAYDLPVQSLRFVPVGYATACYVAEAGPEGRWFVKVWPNTAAGRDAGARQEWVLPLVRALRERDVFPWVAAPRPTTDGRLFSSSDGQRVAVFPVISGATPRGWPRWRRERWEALGRAVATIHAATPTIADVLPPRDPLTTPFAAAMRDLIDAACTGPAGTRSPLGRLLGPLHAEVAAQLDRLDAAQQRCRESDPTYVLCHADLGGDNILFDPDGQLWVLDWDDAALAPPELDVRVGVEGAHLNAFLRTYGSATLLHRDRFEFFLLRRCLEDTHARMVRLLHEIVGPGEQEALLDGIVRWGIEEWRRVDQRLVAIDSVFGQLGR